MITHYVLDNSVPAVFSFLPTFCLTVEILLSIIRLHLFQVDVDFITDYSLLCIHSQHLCTLHEILPNWLFQDGTEDKI